MKSFLAWAMLLAFVMGLEYATVGSLSKNCDEDPWERIDHSAKVSQDKCDEDPWSDLNKSGASQKKCQAVVWVDDCE